MIFFFEDNYSILFDILSSDYEKCGGRPYQFRSKFFL